jgi:hypothetical protein
MVSFKIFVRQFIDHHLFRVSGVLFCPFTKLSLSLLPHNHLLWFVHLQNQPSFLVFIFWLPAREDLYLSVRIFSQIFSDLLFPLVSACGTAAVMCCSAEFLFSAASKLRFRSVCAPSQARQKPVPRQPEHWTCHPFPFFYHKGGSQGWEVSFWFYAILGRWRCNTEKHNVVNFLNLC